MFDLHKNLVSKVIPFVRDNYGEGNDDYVHALMLPAFVNLRSHAADEYFVSEVRADPLAERAYVETLSQVAKAVQRNYAITNHLINEGYHLARYVPFLSLYRNYRDLVFSALRRRDIRAVSDLRHITEIVLSANNADSYLYNMEFALMRRMKDLGASQISKRQGIRGYVSDVVPYALHAALIDTPVSVPPHRVFADVVQFLFGRSASKHWKGFYALAKNKELYPLLIGFAKHWDGELNNRFYQGLSAFLLDGHQAFARQLEEAARGAWGDDWHYLSVSAQKIIPKSKNSAIVLSVGKRRVLDALRGICEQPTCFYPAHINGQRYGLDYALNPKNGEVMPVFAVAKHVTPAGDRIVGRMTFMVDPRRGNIYLTSVPVGGVHISKWVDLARDYARKMNVVSGESRIKRIVVGGAGDLNRFRIYGEDLYDDYIVKGDGVHYVERPKIIPVD